VTTTPTRVEPPVSEEAEAFWEATRSQQLVLPWCRSCGKPFWYPRAICPSCLGDDIDWRPASGKARLVVQGPLDGLHVGDEIEAID